MKPAVKLLLLLFCILLTYSEGRSNAFISKRHCVSFVHSFNVYIKKEIIMWTIAHSTMLVQIRVVQKFSSFSSVTLGKLLVIRTSRIL